MTANQYANLKMEQQRAITLGKVLQECSDVQAIVACEIERLLSVGSSSQHNPGTQSPRDQTPLAHTATLKANLERASRSLRAMHAALEIEVCERTMLGHRFAAAVERESAARDASLHDSLTGMPNRILFRNRLQDGITQATRHDQMFALMFVDLDNFKQINDEYGHSEGDRGLQVIAQRLQAITRSDDLVSRHGGDEFLYLATDIKKESNIPKIAEKIIGVVQTPFEVGAPGHETSVSVGASIGIAVFPRHGIDVDALIRTADRAMYSAKQNRSGYAFAP